MADDIWWGEDAYATAASAKGAKSGGGAMSPKGKTTPQDMIALRDAYGKSEAERDAQREYSSTEDAVNKMDTGPYKAAFLDAVLPNQEGGFWDTAGSVLGLVARPFISDKTIQARDQLETVSAQTAMRGSQMMKGSSSDKDVALMRTAGVSPYKTKGENLRIIKSARRDSEVNQTRAQLKSMWIAKYGSMANASPNGMTFEQAATRAEADLIKNHYSGPRPAPRKAPPSTRRPATNDGWTIKEVK